MGFPKLSKIDKAFLMVLAVVLSVGIVAQAGSGFSGVSGTFGVDPTGEKYVEADDLNISRDWFRGLVNVTDNVLGILQDLIPDAADTYDIGSPASEWQNAYLGTGSAYFWTDQGEYIRSDGVSIITGSGFADRWNLQATLFPNTADQQNIGATSREIQNLYLGTGKLWFYTDQAEYIDSSGSAFEFGIGASDKFYMTSSAFFGASPNSFDLGGTSNEWRDTYITGTIYLYNDQGESLYSNGTHLKIDGSAGVLPDGGNNTGAIGADSERWANGWFTTITAKSSVTGTVIETEISPAPWETFEAGDVVKIYDSEYFVKTSKKLDYVVGVVIDNPQQMIDHYDISWEVIEEKIPVTREVEYLRNETDMYGNIVEIIERRNETVVEYYIEAVEYKLSDNSKTIMYFNQSRPVYETVHNNVTTETAVYRDEGSPVLCVAGVAPVKIIEPVLKNDVLVAGPNGIARPLRVVIEEVKANYGGVPFNWNNVLEVIENFNMRTLGQVMEDSSGDYAQVMLW